MFEAPSIDYTCTTQVKIEKNHLINVKVLIFFLTADSQGSWPPPSVHLGTNTSNARQNVTIDTGAKIQFGVPSVPTMGRAASVLPQSAPQPVRGSGKCLTLILL